MERWIQTCRHELLDRTAIAGEILIDATLASAADRLSATLADRRMPIVIGDVWRCRDLEPFWRAGQRS